MAMKQDSIVALSSGNPPSGVAVIRMSGPASRFVVETIASVLPEPRVAELRALRNAAGEILDQGLVLWFPAPNSFTGEDCAEFQVHGGRAVVAAILNVLTRFDDVRLAAAGEFSRRALENDKLDLTEIEGLADLVCADTEAQRKQAVAHASGKLGARIEGWRERLVHIRAMIEANFDFSDEDDIPGDESEKALALVAPLLDDICSFLDDQRAGEIVRDGLQVVLLGRPNAGKSSLLNALAQRDVAIVTEEAGTTRDLIEVRLDLDGYAVHLVDTAGIRATDSIVEAEGIRRAEERARQADVVLWLADVAAEGWQDQLSDDAAVMPAGSVVVYAKDDKGQHGALGISVRRPGGLDGLIDVLGDELALVSANGESLTVSRHRQRAALEDCATHLEMVSCNGDLRSDLAAEHLRDAAHALGRITGRVDVEHLLDVIFSEFCVGK